MKKTGVKIDMALIDNAFNNLDKVVLDLMEMAKDNDYVLSNSGHDLLEKARSMCADFNVLKKMLTPMLENQSVLHWAIEQHGRWLGSSYGARSIEACSGFTHDIKIISAEGRVYSGRCSDPTNVRVQYDLQLWARSHDCVEAYTREKGHDDWCVLKIPQFGEHADAR